MHNEMYNYECGTQVSSPESHSNANAKSSYPYYNVHGGRVKCS